MYCRAGNFANRPVDYQHMGDWKSTLKKVRDTVHKIFPRELSPSRLLEKVASDAKKKAAKGITVATDKSTALNAAADAATSAKIATLQLQTLPAQPGANFDQPTFDVTSPIPAMAAPNYALPIALGLSAAGIVLYLVMRK